MKHGDFSSLADNYSKYRPGYSEKVLDAMIGMMPSSPEDSVFADVGAGTGIWTRIVSNRGFKSSYAIEPNKNMRENGIADSKNTNINWVEGSGEKTGLADNSIDFLSMASSFHWVDFDKGIAEFARALKPGGLFAALWNPRLVNETPVLKKIQDYLDSLKPDIKRVSSGSSEFTDTLYDKMYSTGVFSDVIYIEAKHSISMSKDAYIGVWKSVNDIQVQLGKELFEQFIDFIDSTIDDGSSLDAYYLTRAWCGTKIK